MDINDLRGLSTLLLMAAFIGLIVWAYSKNRKKDFDEAANLPFADEAQPPENAEAHGGSSR